MWRKILQISFLLCLAFGFIAPLSASAADTWTLETIDAPRYLNGYFSRIIAIDPTTNQLHIAYGGDQLYHAWFDGQSWQQETVDSSTGVGLYASIAIDSGGGLHISYLDGANEKTKYATNVSGSWVVETLDSSGRNGWFSSIAIDSSDNVHIAYLDLTANRLKYATNASGAWVFSFIDSAAYGGTTAISIALDAADRVHIAYQDVTNMDLKYATNASGAWVVSVIDSAGDTGCFPSIAVDSHGKVHIGYYDATNASLRYAANQSGAWELSTIDVPYASGAKMGQYPSLAVDRADAVHIVYMDAHGVLERYATNASGAWVISNITTYGNAGLASLQTDADNKAHVVLLDRYRNLQHGTNRYGTWSFSIIDSTGWVTATPMIAVDLNNSSHISYGTYPNYDLNYATNISGLWETYTFDANGVPHQNSLVLDEGGFPRRNYIAASNMLGWTYFHAVAMDSNDKVHIVYNYINATTRKGEIRHTTNASSSWTTEVLASSSIANTGITYGSTVSLAIDPSDHLHVTYLYYYTNGIDLKYATDVTGSWTTETIGSLGNVVTGGISPIAVDQQGKVHISYLDAVDPANIYLKYATNATGTWTTIAVERLNASLAAVKYYSTSIAVDTNGAAHIAYTDISSSMLRYATNSGGSWSATTVDITFRALNSSTSIATDARNKVHISYFSYHRGNITYLTNESGAWVISPLTSQKSNDCGSSIALDSAGGVHISYAGVYSASNGDLQYATKVATFIDADGDGYSFYDDCNDSSALEHPGQVWYEDADGDGYTSGQSLVQCSRPVNFKAAAELVSASVDCNDADPFQHPDVVWYEDVDADGYSSGSMIVQCSRPAGFRLATELVATSGDCDDANPDINPGAAEICDGVDNNCSGTVDEEFDVGAACIITSGSCSINSVKACSADGMATVCSAVAGLPPVLTMIGDKTGNEGETLAFTISATDVACADLSYSASNLPTGAAFDPATETFSWTPGFEQAGSYQNILFTVTNGLEPPMSSFETITVIVGNVNRPPVLSPIGNKTISEAETLSFAVAASDPDNDGLVFTASNLPAGAVFDPATQTFSWTPGFEQAGSYQNVLFTVADNGNLPLQTYEMITLTVGNVNRPPLLAPIGNKTVTAGQTLVFVVTATDPDNDSITCSAQNLPAGAVFDPATQTFSWTPAFDQVGTYQAIQFVATDSGTPMQMAMTTITITVGSSNRAPEFLPVGIQRVDDEKTLRFSVKANDPDGDAVSYSTGPLPAGASFDSAKGLFAWRPSEHQSGKYTVLFYATDGKGGADTLEVLIIVGHDRSEDIEDLIEKLEKYVEHNLSDKHVRHSYKKHLKKAEHFLEHNKHRHAKDEMTEFIAAVSADRQQGRISAALASELLSQAQWILLLL